MDFTPLDVTLGALRAAVEQFDELLGSDDPETQARVVPAAVGLSRSTAAAVLALGEHVQGLDAR